MIAQHNVYARNFLCVNLYRLLARYTLLFVLFVIAGISTAVAAVLQSNWVGDPRIGEARLISAVIATGDLEELPLGLEFRLAPGWKIYWRTPGDAGLPPAVDLKVNGNAVTSTIKWPLPKRFNSFGFDNFGYDTKVILPLQVSGYNPGRTVRLSGQIEALVCADICVPLGGSVALTIPSGIALATADYRAIAKATSLVPRKVDNPLIEVNRIWQVADALHLQLNSPAAIDDIFIEGIDGVTFKKPNLRGAEAIIAIDASKTQYLAGRNVTVTIVAGEQFAEQVLTVGAYAPSATANNPRWTIFIFAFLGGLILNFMPCVLPVLAIKLGSILASAGQQKSLIRLRFLCTSGGIVTSFLILATVLEAMRLAGAQIGWGIQFQSPVFLTVMILLIGVFVLAMLDRLILPIPAFAQRLTRVVGSASSLRRLLAGDFLTGILATILATPCSAPFVGVAVGFALTGSVAELFGIFFALGIGLAIPWILIMIVPGLISALPKPGPWMDWLKRVLALFLVGTALWLVSILFTISGAFVTVVIAISVVMVIRGLTGKDRFWLRPSTFAGVIMMMWVLISPSTFTAISWRDVSANGALSNSSGPSAVVWQDWQPGAIGPLVDDGKTVFVDVTAAWCITCKINKTLVLEQAPVAPYLRQLVERGQLVLLKADWTRPNGDIGAFLASYQRYGIPFNIIYGPHALKGVRLGELLTAESVLAALNKSMNGSSNL